MDQRRRLLMAAGLATVAMPVSSQSFPSRPLRLVVPLAPGGATDIVSRALADKLGSILGQPVVVENRAGAGGTVGSQAVASATPDGYTLLMGTVGTLAVSPSMYRKLPYDTDRDLTPVTLVSSGNFALVVPPTLAATNLRELIELARSKPGELNYGSAGNGSMLHLGMELFNRGAGLKTTHVPYKSSGQLVTALMASEIQLGLPDLPSVLQQIRAGRLRILAVAGASRDPLLPEVPTIAESGVSNAEISSWLGVMAPASTPEAVLGRLNAAVNQALQAPDLVTRLSEAGMRPAGSSIAEFRSFLASERSKWDGVVKAAGVTID